MKFIDDWRHLLPRLWSVRLAALAFVLQVFALGFDIASGVNLHWALRLSLGVLAAVCTVAAIYARIVLQRSLSDGRA